jgi:hypothetical protein
MESKAGNMAAVNKAYDAYRAAVEEAQAYDDVYFTLEYSKGRDDALRGVLEGKIDLQAVAERSAREDSQGGSRADQSMHERWNKAAPVTHKLFCETAGCGNEATNFVAGHELCDDCIRKEPRLASQALTRLLEQQAACEDRIRKASSLQTKVILDGSFTDDEKYFLYEALAFAIDRAIDDMPTKGQ